MKMRIVVGSTSRHKIEAVMAACTALQLDADVVGVAAPSGAAEQPFGVIETGNGAAQRALGAANMSPGSVAIGIESGILHLGGWFDAAVVVVRDNVDGREFVAVSGAVPFDHQDVMEAERRGFHCTTVGAVVASRTGCDATDPIAHITGGAVKRAELLAEAVKVALSQYLVRRRRRARVDLDQLGSEAETSC